MKKNIYILSGLGVDERVFQKLDLSSFSPIFIKWIEPLREEKIENYAARILSQIKTEKPIIIGLSFGGMMSIEIAKQIETEKIILISSAKTRTEIPFYFRLCKLLPFHKLIPTNWLKKSNFLTNWIFGTASDFDKNLLKEILADTDNSFLKWAINAIIHWNNTLKIEDVIHIHGTIDRILPIHFLQAQFKIKNGGHLMVLNRADEISKILTKVV